MDGRIRIHGGDHPTGLAIRHVLAGTLAAAGAFSDAIGCHQALLDSRSLRWARITDVLWPRLTIWPLASATAGNRASAWHCCWRCSTTGRALLAWDDHDAMLTRSDLALWLDEAGAWPEAIREYQVLLLNRTIVVGQDDPEAIANRFTLTRIFSSRDSGATRSAVTRPSWTTACASSDHTTGNRI